MRDVTRGGDGSLEETYGRNSGDLRKVIANYMLTAPLVFATPLAPRSSDPGDGTQEGGYHTDGEWFWSNAGAKLFRDGRIDLDPEFVVHVLRQRTPPMELSEDQLQEVMQFLLELDR